MPDIISYNKKQAEDIPALLDRLRAKCKQDGIGVRVRSFPFSLPGDIGIFGITGKTVKVLEITSCKKGSRVNLGPEDSITLLLIPAEE